MFKLCAPSIIYLIFSITQILIDIYKGMYNTAFMKIIVASMVTLLLNILCESGLTGISWIIVFIPFILMTVIVSVLLYVFGLDAASGNLNYTCKDKDGSTSSSLVCPEEVTIDKNGNIIIYDPEYNSSVSPVYYNYPNIIIPNPQSNDKHNVNVLPKGKSSIEYIS